MASKKFEKFEKFEKTCRDAGVQVNPLDASVQPGLVRAGRWDPTSVSHPTSNCVALLYVLLQSGFPWFVDSALH